MPKFRSLKELEKYAQTKLDKTLQSKEVENVFKSAMSEAVEEQVYDAYRPSVYPRRGDDGGLSDHDNMVFTERTRSGKTLISLFENLTVGSDAPVYGNTTDSMSGYFISNLIENGSDRIHNSHSNSVNGWYELGEWSEPRPFALYTAMMINSQSHYNNALKRIIEKGINT